MSTVTTYICSRCGAYYQECPAGGVCPICKGTLVKNIEKGLD